MLPFRVSDCEGIGMFKTRIRIYLAVLVKVKWKNLRYPCPGIGIELLKNRFKYIDRIFRSGNIGADSVDLVLNICV